MLAGLFSKAVLDEESTVWFDALLDSYDTRQLQALHEAFRYLTMRFSDEIFLLDLVEALSVLDSEIKLTRTQT